MFEIFVGSFIDIRLGEALFIVFRIKRWNHLIFFCQL